MSFPLYDVKLFNYYRRYKWNAVAFAALQDTLINFPATISAQAFGDAVLSGLVTTGNSGLNVNVNPGFAVNQQGNLMGIPSGLSVAVPDNSFSLVVINPVTANTNTISRPTSPFDPVPLNTEQTAAVNVRSQVGSYPNKNVGDVILFGVQSAGGVITSVDNYKCELIGKRTEINDIITVGSGREADFNNIAAAVAAASTGNIIRVKGNLNITGLTSTINIPVNGLRIEFDPGITLTDGGAGTGFNITGTEVKIMYGRFAGFGTAAITISGNYCMAFGQRFAANTLDVNDTTGTSTVLGEINE